MINPEAIHNSVKWLDRSQARTNSSGFSHSYHILLKKWYPAYPETSGYIIDTLVRLSELNYEGRAHAQHFIEPNLHWLCGIQSNDGSYYSGTKKSLGPSSFNTAQIILGLQHYNKFESTKDHDGVLQRAINWTLGTINRQGVWEKYNYVKGWYPLYYLKALAAIFQCEDKLDINQRAKCYTSYELYKKRFLSGDVVSESSFYPTQACTLHSLMYSIEGLLECALRVGDNSVVKPIIAFLECIIENFENGFPAGRYISKSKGLFQYINTSGNFQLSLCLLKTSELGLRQDFKKIAIELFNKTQLLQLKEGENTKGSFYASYPKYGGYFPFRCLNWINKYYLDVVFELTK